MACTEVFRIERAASSFCSVSGKQPPNFPPYGKPGNRHFNETLYHKGFCCTGTVNEKVSATINPL